MRLTLAFTVILCVMGSDYDQFPNQIEELNGLEIVVMGKLEELKTEIS